MYHLKNYIEKSITNLPPPSFPLYTSVTARPGQVHFFPAIGNVEAMEKAFESHECAKLDLKK